MLRPAMTVICGTDEIRDALECLLENIGCTAPGLHPTDSIARNHPCPKLREVRDEQCPHGPLGKKFYCSRQIPPALNSRNPFPRLFLSGKTWRNTEQSSNR